MGDPNKIVEVRTGQTFKTIEEAEPITVKRLTDDYVAALETLTGSPVIGVDIDVERQISHDGFCVAVEAVIAGAETSIRTR